MPKKRKIFERCEIMHKKILIPNDKLSNPGWICCPERYDLWLGVTLQKVKTNWAIWVSITHMVLSMYSWVCMYSQNKGFILVKTSLRFSKLGFTNAHVENFTVSKQKLVKCNWTVIGSLCDLAITWKVGVLWRTHQDQKFCNTVILIFSYTII